MTARPLTLLVTLLVAASLVACGAEEAGEDTAGPTMIEVADVGFQTPESVLHDATADVYLVSNINGAPTEKDGNGFISRLSPEGQVQDLSWISGEADGVTLHAPKGMAIRGDTLYVADIDCVKMFVRTTGAAAGEVCIRGATFLNDVAVAGDGRLYVTDSGLNADFTSNGTDAVWRFSPTGESSRLTSGPQLGGPNGIAFDGETAYVTTFGSGEVYTLGTGGERRVMVAANTPDRRLDGIAMVDEGGYIFTSWGDRALLRINVAGAETVILPELESPADVGYDAQRNRALVPLFTPNRVVIVDVPSAPPPAAF